MLNVIIHFSEVSTDMKRTGQQKIVSFFSHKQLSLTCSKCQCNFFGHKKLSEHMISCNRWHCLVCKKTFHYESTYTKHLQQNCPPKYFSCNTCSKSYSRNSDLAAHKRKCVIETVLQCDKCKKCFLTSAEQKTHLCPFMEINAACGIVGTDGENAKEHSPNDTSTKPFPRTFIFYDLETTGLIQDKRYPDITQICLIAIPYDGLYNVAEHNTPSVHNKLTLCFRPVQQMSASAKHITGIDIFTFSIFYLNLFYIDLSHRFGRSTVKHST